MTDPVVCILDKMATYGATRFYAKQLAPNDNSKNQVYLGAGFGALNIIPHGEVEEDGSLLAGSVRDRAKAPVDFWWMDKQGISPAPDAQLILYPKYPEVRMSGFLRGAVRAPAPLMRSRDDGRVLFFGVCPDGRVIGYAVDKEASEAVSLRDKLLSLETSGVFVDLQSLKLKGASSRKMLLDALRRIQAKGWVPSKKMSKKGEPLAYDALNGGGYTLEAELGISPNGYAEPDYLGWEVKQYGVRDFVKYFAKSPVTLMTPEPTGGLYRDEGVEAFLRRYGYPDKSGKEGRINFGGVYANGRDFHADTGLRLVLEGYDPEQGKITDVDGQIALINRTDKVAASWRFKGLISHWNRKHAKAVYVPSMMRAPPPQYAYGSCVELCEGADVLLLLRALSSGTVYYDPGIKMEKANTPSPVTKRRSQFRVKHNDLSKLYQTSERVLLT